MTHSIGSPVPRSNQERDSKPRRLSSCLVSFSQCPRPSPAAGTSHSFSERLSQSARVSVSPRLSQPASQSARVSVSLRLSQPASQLEAMGITLALDVDFDLGDDTSQPVITSTNDAPFTLSGDCGEAGGAIEWIEPASDTQETVCGSDQRWSITLDRSGFADQVFDFKFRDPRADGSRSIEVEAPSCFKISQGRAPFVGQPSSSGVNPAQSGSTAAVRSS